MSFKGFFWGWRKKNKLSLGKSCQANQQYAQ